MQPDAGADAGVIRGAGASRRVQPLMALANVLTVLLMGDVVLAAAIEVVRWRDGNASLWWRVQMDQGPFVVVLWVSLALTAFVFLLWSYRGVVNAEACPTGRRYARDWIFWGWVIPVVNLWFPFRIMNDLLRASRPGWRRGLRTLLPASWWIGWLAFQAAANFSLPMSWPNFGLFAAAALACIVVVRAISAGELGTPGAPKTPGAPARTA